MLILFPLFLLSRMMIIHPQLFVDNFSSKFSALTALHDFLCSSVSPVIFTVLLAVMIFCALVGILVGLPYRRWTRFCLRISREHAFLKIALPLAIAAVVMLVTLYEQKIIFYKTSSQPNIIIISSDAVRPDRFSMNGNPRATTPNLDKIAAESYQLRGVYSAVPRTFPSWVSILTSQYPLRHNIRHMFPRSRERNMPFETACTELKKHGYRTAVISDFAGDIFPRINLGFDTVRAPYLSFDELIKQILIERQVFLLPFVTGTAGRAVFPEIRGIAKYSVPARITGETESEIKAARGNPFFITVFYSITHFPFSAPYPYYKTFTAKDYTGPYKYFKQVVVKIGSSDGGAFEGSKEISDADREQVQALYDGCLKNYDVEIGRLFEFLKREGLLENTVILFTSDHGENIYDKNLGMGHGEHLKGYCALEVPFILHTPHLAKELKGKTHSTVASSIDIMPTVFDAAGIARPAFFCGRSLLAKNTDLREVEAYNETGIWFDNNKKTTLFFQHQRIDYPDITSLSDVDAMFYNEMVIKQKYQNIVTGAKYRAIYCGKYKLIYIPLYSGPVFELYDIQADPYNQNNLAQLQPDILSGMKKKFYRFMERESAGNFINVKGVLVPQFAEPVM